MIHSLASACETGTIARDVLTMSPNHVGPFSLSLYAGLSAGGEQPV